MFSNRRRVNESVHLRRMNRDYQWLIGINYREEVHGGMIP